MGHDIIQLHPFDVGVLLELDAFLPRGGRTGIVAVDVHATDREHGPGRGGELCHTMINFL